MQYYIIALWRNGGRISVSNMNEMNVFVCRALSLSLSRSGESV